MKSRMCVVDLIRQTTPEYDLETDMDEKLSQRQVFFNKLDLFI